MHTMVDATDPEDVRYYYRCHIRHIQTHPEEFSGAIRNSVEGVCDYIDCPLYDGEYTQIGK